MTLNWRQKEAVRHLQSGGVISHPTEAVYGLACNPNNEKAVKEILRLKKRASEKGLILIAASFEQLAPYLSPLPDKTLKPIFESWPGPVTWLIPAAKNTPRWLTGKHASLAVRVTSHKLTSQLCQAYGGALVSTSANPSGHPAAITYNQVRHYFHNQVMILRGRTDGRKQPSTIIDALSGQRIR